MSGGFRPLWHSGKAELAQQRPVDRGCRIGKPRQP